MLLVDPPPTQLTGPPQAFCSDGTVKPTQANLYADDTPNYGLVYQS